MPTPRQARKAIEMFKDEYLLDYILFLVQQYNSGHQAAR